MTSSIATSQSTAASTKEAWRSGPFTKFFAFTPLWVQLYATFAAPTYFRPMFAQPPGPLGIPSGLWIFGLDMLWMLIGVSVLWGARSRVLAALVYLVFTIPATFAVVFGPAVVLILQNPGT